MRHFPNSIRAGITLDVRQLLRRYLAPEWVMSLVMRGPSAIDLTGTADGQHHVLVASAVDTAEWAPGAYQMSLRVTNSATSEVAEVDSGFFTVLPDLSVLVAGTDARSHVQITLENIEAIIEKRATRDQERYLINGRELWRTPIGDLLKLRDRYKAELNRIRAAQGGKLFNQQVRVRF